MSTSGEWDRTGHSDTAALWRRANEIIPGGTSTGGMRVVEDLADVMPAFIERASGCHLTGVDGLDYIDYGASLGPIILGHGHPAVQEAVREQLDKGVLFSLASPLETELARNIQDMVPSAEMVRFIKTGSDAMSACIRIARAVTGRDLIVITGYHGWHDAFSAVQPGGPSFQSAGVPEAVTALSLLCRHGDKEALAGIFADHPGEIAAVLTLPYKWGPEDRGPEAAGSFLRAARELTTTNGALLIFDEVFTGFRLAPGGGAEYFGVTPDLAAYAKAIANGYPLAAFAGAAKYMQALGRGRISTTYATEALSLAAGLATLRVMREEPVHEQIWRRGRDLMDGIGSALNSQGLPGTVSGIPPRFNVGFSSGDADRDKALHTAFYRGLLRRGVFSTGGWIMSYAHSQTDVEDTISAAMEAGQEANSAVK